jgi:hypothetical protein
MGEVIERSAKRFARSEDIGLGNGRMIRAATSEEIPAQQCAQAAEEERVEEHLFGKEVFHFRLIAVDDARERVVGEYTFNHSPPPHG